MSRLDDAFTAVAAAIQKIKPDHAGLEAWKSKKFSIWMISTMTLLAVGYVFYLDGKPEALLDCARYIVWVSIAYIVGQGLVDAAEKISSGVATGLTAWAAREKTDPE